jgi:adenylyltransferase/sulfurtransferase
MSPQESIRYSRHLSLPEIGVAGQQKLRAARVLLIGAGGLGSPSSLYLAASGVGTLGLIDYDHIDISNLQRQILYDDNSVGRSKVQAAQERLRALNPQVAVIAHEVRLSAANVCPIVRDYDLVLDGSDRFGTRYLANDACVIERKPLVSAAIHRFEGQAMTYIPEQGPCYRCLFPDPPGEGLVPNCAEAGVLGVLPGVMGTIQATEAIKLIVGIGEPLLGRLLTYDALGMRFEEYRFKRRRDCAVCAEQPTILQPRDLQAAGSAASLASVRRLSAGQLQSLWQQSLIIDVREPREFSVAHLPGSLNVPLAQLEQRMTEIAVAGKDHVFVCRSGARSLRASALAVERGLHPVAHLEGGLLAWWREIDPSFEVAPP